MSNAMKSILKNILKTSSLFSGLNVDETERISKYFHYDLYKSGDVVFTEGSFSENVYFVSSGSFEIVSFNLKYQNSKQLRVLKAGEHFSELSILTKRKHGTSAFALEDSALIRIEASSFFDILKEFPSISINLTSDISNLIQSTIDRAHFVKYLSDQTVVKFEPAMISLMPLKMIQTYKCIPLRIDGNHLVVGMTNPLDLDFYLQFKAEKPDFELRVILLDELQYSQLLTKMRNLHIGNLKTSSPTESNSSPQNGHTPDPKTNIDIKEFIQKSILFKKLKPKVLDQIIPFLQFTSYAAHEEIFSPEKNNENIYLLLSGAVRLFKRNKSTAAMVPLYKLYANDPIYEVGVFNNKEKILTARTLVESQICVLPKKLFDQLIKVTDFSISIAISLAETLQKINSFNDGIPVLDSIDLKVAYKLKNFFPTQFAYEYKVVAVQQSGMEVTVATPHPTDQKMIAALEKSLPRYLFRFNFISEEIYTYWVSQLEEQSNRQQSNPQPGQSVSQDSTIKLYKLNTQEAVQAFDLILEKAIHHNASDIHLESLESFLIVRYRIDGELIQLWENFDFDIGQSIVRISKLNAKLNITENRLPQDGQFRHKLLDQEYGLRLSSVPTRHGEKIVLRIAGRTNSVIPLRHLSREKKTISFLNFVSRNKQGIFLVAGPTGSGKSTTLYSIINEMNKPGLNIVTIEDPVEVDLPGVNQIEIHPAIGLTHDVILKHILRQDPDIILINEIRDVNSMQLALDASMTGHLVLSTIHANNSTEVIDRLKELSVNSTSQIASTILGVVAQRLVRTVCNSCKVVRPITDSEQSKLIHLGETYSMISEVCDSKGCSDCYYTGFKGQIPLFEHWQRTPELADILVSGISGSELSKKVRRLGFETMLDYGYRMVALGLTTFKEIDEILFGVVQSDIENVSDTDSAEEPIVLNQKKSA